VNLELDLQIASEQTGLPSEADILAWLSSFAALEALTVAEITVRIVDADESEALNYQYRGKTKPTNVLSFPFENEMDLPIPLLGDLVVCAPVVRAEAEEQKKPEWQHWAHLIIHGALHLVGYDHINDEDAEIMENKERAILAKLDIPDPYEIRTEQNF